MISGSGKKVGKTTLACELINRFSKEFQLIAIKISPHFHQQKSNNEIIYNSNKFIIEKETKPNLIRDSSKMLKAGAFKVYYIQTNDVFIPVALDIVVKMEEKKYPVICESGAAWKHIIPGAVIYIEKPGQKDTSKNAECKHNANILFHYNENSVNFDITGIYYKNNSWIVIP